MEVVVKARLKQNERGNWLLILSANSRKRAQFLKMFLGYVCPRLANQIILSPANTIADTDELVLIFDISSGPKLDARAEWEFLTISLTDLQNKIATQGIGPYHASRRAIEDFPKTVQKYLDQNWEILTGDSNLVYLKKKSPKQEHAQLMPLREYLSNRDTFIMTEVYAELKYTAQLAGISDEDLDSKLRKAFSYANTEWHEAQSETHKHQVEMSRV